MRSVETRKARPQNRSCNGQPKVRFVKRQDSAHNTWTPKQELAVKKNEQVESENEADILKTKLIEEDVRGRIEGEGGRDAQQTEADRE